MMSRKMLVGFIRADDQELTGRASEAALAVEFCTEN